jgi:hypothetical protein
MKNNTSLTFDSHEDLMAQFGPVEVNPIKDELKPFGQPHLTELEAAKQAAVDEVCKLMVLHNVSNPEDLFVDANYTDDTARYYFNDKEIPRPKQGW